MIDLRPKDMTIVRDILQTYVPNTEVWAFGSRVSQKAHAASDLDLVVIGQEKLPSQTLAKLSIAFQDSDLPIRVDVLDWHRLPPEVQKEIKKRYEVL